MAKYALWPQQHKHPLHLFISLLSLILIFSQGSFKKKKPLLHPHSSSFLSSIPKPYDHHHCKGHTFWFLETISKTLSLHLLKCNHKSSLFFLVWLRLVASWRRPFSIFLTLLALVKAFLGSDS